MSSRILFFFFFFFVGYFYSRVLSRRQICRQVIQHLPRFSRGWKSRGNTVEPCHVSLDTQIGETVLRLFVRERNIGREKTAQLLLSTREYNSRRICCLGSNEIYNDITHRNKLSGRKMIIYDYIFYLFFIKNIKLYLYIYCT